MKGQCGTLSGGCLPGADDLILCGCGGATIDVSCISASAALLQPTATGASCAGDGGLDDVALDVPADAAALDAPAE